MTSGAPTFLPMLIVSCKSGPIGPDALVDWTILDLGADGAATAINGEGMVVGSWAFDVDAGGRIVGFVRETAAGLGIARPFVLESGVMTELPTPPEGDA